MHLLRHPHTSHLLSSGVPLPAVSARLGHSSVRTTPESLHHLLGRRGLRITGPQVCKKKYRPGGVHGPHRWTWFLTVIGNEFSPTEQSHLPERPASPRPEYQGNPEVLMQGIEALESIVASVLCSRCGESVIQYADGTFKNCTCGGRADKVNREKDGLGPQRHSMGS